MRQRRTARSLAAALCAAAVALTLSSCGRGQAPPASGKFAIGKGAEQKGCRSCHDGLAVINEKMQPFLLAAAQQQFEGKGSGYECAICHDGNPAANDKATAHRGMAANPASMWVLHEGRGCAKCHDKKGSVTTLIGKPLKKPVGGRLMEQVVTSGDPTGKTGFNYTYRMARGLMSLETGKANKSLSANGVIPKGTFPYADFTMDDPDGAVPCAGSDQYKRWVAKAIESGFLRRLSGVEEIPHFERGEFVFGSGEKAGFADMHRKQCARCHVWGEGRGKRGDLRASGCASCHILYGNDGKYEGKDPTILASTGDRPHPLKHQITLAIPAAQCSHCHTRGKRIGTTFSGMFEYDYVKDQKAPPFDKDAKPQEPLYTKEYLHVRKDVHFERGMQCGDCHTSIDVHGDGNIYPVTFYQVEVSCYDCHGTPQKFPWDLPVGYGTPVILDGVRGAHKTKEGAEYLITSKGNVKGNWIKEGNEAYVVSRYTGKRHRIPLLKGISDAGKFKTRQGKVAMATVHQHIEKLECYACHSTWAPQCFGCHMQYDRRKKGTDWVTTAKKVDRKTGRQTITKTAGDISVENRSFLRWESPILGVNLKGKVAPLIPGCQVFYTYLDAAGNVKTLNKHYTTSTGHNSLTLAPVQPHAITLVSRTCEDCHANPKALGYGTANSRSAGKLLEEEPMFQNLLKGVYGDIPDAKTGRWQVPRIEGFPHALDELVTREGHQVQNMPLPEDRPLNGAERAKAEREGVCIACHQYHGTPEWDKVIERYGRALTPTEHDEMVARAMKSVLGQVE